MRHPSDRSAIHSARLVVLAAGIAAMLALIGALRIRPDASLADMMASDSPAVGAMIDLARHFPVADELVVIATAQPSAIDHAESLAAFAQRLQHIVTGSERLGEMIRSVRYHRRSEEERAFTDDVVIPDALYYLSDQQFACLRDHLSSESIEAAIRRSERLITAPGAAGEAFLQRIAHDPLHLAECLESDQLIFPSDPGASAEDDDLMLSRDRRSLAIRLSATQPAGDDLRFTRRLVDEVAAAAREANLDDLQLEFTGAYAIASFAERSIRRDMIVSIGTSVPLILLLFLVTYRRLTLLVFTLLPVALGIVFGFGAFSLISTSLTPLTAVIGAVIGGLGVDFAIHYIARARHLARSADIQDDAAARASRQLMRPLALAAGTSIAAFAAVATSTVAAVRDFGLVGMFGLAGAVVTALFVLPALVRLCPGVLPQVGSPHRIGRDVGTLVTVMVHRHRRPIGVVSLLLFLSLAGSLLLGRGRPILALSSDPHLLHPQPNPPLQIEEVMADRFEVPADDWPVLITAESPRDLLIRAHEVRRSVEAVQGLMIQDTRSVASLFPDPRTGEARAAEIRSIDADRVVADLDRSLADSIFEPAAFDEYRRTIQRMLMPGPPPDLADLAHYPALASRLIASSPRSEGGRDHHAVLIIGFEQASGQSMRESRIHALQSALNDSGATLTGTSVVGHETQRSILRNLGRAFLISFGGIIVFLLLTCRRVIDLICVISPAAIGLLVLLAFVHLRGDELNLVNFVGLPLLVGLGIDDGIFLLSAWNRDRRQLQEVGSTCTAMILTSATTIIGFGSLMLTGTPAIRSLGLLTSVGIIGCLFATLFLLLPLLILRAEREP